MISALRFNECQAALKFTLRGLSQLMPKRVIGCTNTGAAKYRKDIADLSPDVLLVEEAGEILESHVIMALSSSTTQMYSHRRSQVMAVVLILCTGTDHIFQATATKSEQLCTDGGKRRRL